MKTETKPHPNAEILAQSVGVSGSTLCNGLYNLANVVRALDHQSRDLLEALKPNEEAQRLTPLQAMVATHYQGGEFDHIETQDDAQNVGDGLFTFCINEAGDAGGKSELVNMLNRAIEQLRSLVGELEAVDGRVGEGVAGMTDKIDLPDNGVCLCGCKDLMLAKDLLSGYFRDVEQMRQESLQQVAEGVLEQNPGTDWQQLLGGLEVTPDTAGAADLRVDEDDELASFKL